MAINGTGYFVTLIYLSVSVEDADEYQVISAGVSHFMERASRDQNDIPLRDRYVFISDLHSPNATQVQIDLLLARMSMAASSLIWM